jgi:xanthine dehydrogenase accessory factor
MFVDGDGNVEGSITGGCVESAVAQEALAVLEGGGPPVLREYGISDELAGTVGLTCGGLIDVFVSELRAGSRAAMREALSAIVARRPCAIATLLDGEAAGARLMVDADESLGSLGVGTLLDQNVERDARGLIAQGRSVVRRYGADGTTLGDDLRIQVTAYATAPRMVIFGAIDFSAALAPLAHGLGYEVTICDPRRAFVESPRFSAAAKTVVAWPDSALRGQELGPRDAVLVFSHDPKLDVPALQVALQTDAGYIGALGSRRTTAERRARLLDEGASEQDLNRIFAPCGLNIGSSTPEETALAILAEIVAHRAGRDGRPLRAASGPIRRDEDATERGSRGPF